MRKSRKWTAERREKFMQTMRIKNGKTIKNDLEEFLDSIWHKLSLKRKRDLFLTNILENQ